MGTHQSHRRSASSARASTVADAAAIPAADTAPAADTVPDAPSVVRRYAPKQPGHSRPVLWLGAGHRHGALGLPWIGLRPSLRRRA